MTQYERMIKGLIYDPADPEDSSFKATFTDMELTDCKWRAHDGQAPD